MTIRIEEQINSETIEIWVFTTFDFKIVFTGWQILTKPKGKTKWNTDKFWDKYGRSLELHLTFWGLTQVGIESTYACLLTNAEKSTKVE